MASSSSAIGSTMLKGRVFLPTMPTPYTRYVTLVTPRFKNSAFTSAYNEKEQWKEEEKLKLSYKDFVAYNDFCLGFDPYVWWELCFTTWNKTLAQTDKRISYKKKLNCVSWIGYALCLKLPQHTIKAWLTSVIRKLKTVPWFRFLMFEGYLEVLDASSSFCAQWISCPRRQLLRIKYFFC